METNIKNWNEYKKWISKTKIETNTKIVNDNQYKK